MRGNIKSVQLVFIFVILLFILVGGLLSLTKLDKATYPAPIQDIDFGYVIASQFISKSWKVTTESIMLYNSPTYDPPPKTITNIADVVGKLVRVDRLRGQNFLPEMLFNISDWRGTSSPTIVEHVAYFWDIEGNFHAVDIVRKQELWHFETEPPWLSDAKTSVYSPPSIVNGVIYFFAGSKGKLYALNAKTGQVIWAFEQNLLKKQKYFSPPIVQNETIYFVSQNDDTMYAIDTKTGQETWQFTVKNLVLSEPFVMDQMVYFTDSTGKLYVLEAPTGQIIYTLE